MQVARRSRDSRPVRTRFQFNRFNAFDDVDRDTISLLRSVSKRTAGKTHMDDSKCLRLKKRHHRIGKSESVADRVVGKYLPNDSSSANAFCSRFPTHCELSSNHFSPPRSRPLSAPTSMLAHALRASPRASVRTGASCPVSPCLARSALDDPVGYAADPLDLDRDRIAGMQEHGWFPGRPDAIRSAGSDEVAGLERHRSRCVGGKFCA